DGVSDGLRTKWYSSGAKQSEAHIVDGKLGGVFQKWHENGMLSEQIPFSGGQPEGLSFAYFPSGCLKARVLMKAGKPLEQEFWKDGEKKVALQRQRCVSIPAWATPQVAEPRTPRG